MAGTRPSTVVIGRISTTFRTAGALKVEALTDLPERFLELVGREVELELPNGESRRATVSHVELRRRDLLVTFHQYSSMEKAAELRGAYIKVPSSEALALPEGSFYHFQLIGLRVLSATGEDLGEIREILQGATHDIYVTDKTMIPALRVFVKEVDLEAGKMIVDLPPELRVEE